MAARVAPVMGVLGALLLLGAAVVAPRPDEWKALVATGDRLAATGGTVTTEAGELSPRAAYLLAFHHAQDALDVPRMLAAAERLERLGDVALAACLRSIVRHAHGLNGPQYPCSSARREILSDHKM